MRLKIFLIIILFLAVIFFVSRHRTPDSTKFPPPVEDAKKPEVAPLDVKVPESLRVNFKAGLDYCKTQNIPQSGAFELCVLYYIYERSRTDHEIILKINTYCDKTTTNECDRRNCVENILLF